MTSDFLEYKRPAASGNMHASVYLHSQAPRTMLVGRSEHPSKREYSFSDKAQLRWERSWESVSPVSNHRSGSSNCSISALLLPSQNQVSAYFDSSAPHVRSLINSSCGIWRVVQLQFLVSFNLNSVNWSIEKNHFSALQYLSTPSLYFSQVVCSAWVLCLVSLDLTRRHQRWQIIRLLCHQLLDRNTKICSTTSTKIFSTKKYKDLFWEKKHKDLLNKHIKICSEKNTNHLRFALIWLNCSPTCILILMLQRRNQIFIQIAETQMH